MRNSRFVLREEVDKVFEEHDKDLDGKLSWDEFCGEETKNEKAFKLMDINKNGKVSKEVSLYYFFAVTVAQNRRSEVLFCSVCFTVILKCIKSYSRT